MNSSTVQLPGQALLRSEGPGIPRLQSAQDVAKEFEAILLAQLLKTMRETGEKNGLFGQSTGSEIYSQMMDQEVARAMSRAGGIGLAEQLELGFEQAQNRLEKGEQ